MPIPTCFFKFQIVSSTAKKFDIKDCEVNVTIFMESTGNCEIFFTLLDGKANRNLARNSERTGEHMEAFEKMHRISRAPSDKVLDLKPDLEYHVYESYSRGDAPENWESGIEEEEDPDGMGGNA